MKANFYRLTAHREADDAFDRCVSQLVQQFRQQEGAYLDCGGLHLRIEQFHRDGTNQYCTGDIIRQQRDDIPPAAPIGGALRPNTVPLGHRTAFLYHFPTRSIALQVNKIGVGIGALLDCITQHLNHDGFGHMPILSQDTIDDLMTGGARSVTIKFAGPENVAAVDDASRSDIQNLDHMRRLFDAPAMEITCGFDSPKPGGLNATEVARFIRRLYNSNLTPKKIQIKQEGANEMLDLIGRRLSYIDPSIQLDSGNINGHYLSRKRFLIDAWNANRVYITQYFRTQAA